MPLERGYAVLDVQSTASKTRTFTGLASTPDLDTQNHIVDPAGVRFRNPVPLLFHHDQTQVIGSARLIKVADGIQIEATIPTLDEPGPLKTRADEAWQCIKAGLMRGLSIGHRPVAGTIQRLNNGVLKFLQTDIYEVSLVTVPANANATILLVKSLASPKETAMSKQTTGEHIQNLENKRAALAARMGEIMRTAAGEDRTLDETEAPEHDGLSLQVKSLDADLKRWREMETLNITTATAVPPVSALRTTSTAPVISVRPNVPIGTQFVRATMAKLFCAAHPEYNPVDYAQQRWGDSTPEVALYLKAAIAPGTATDATWAGPLVNPIVADFLELLRAATIVDKVAGLRKVPFNCKVPSQTAGGTYGWVGESKPKPVTKLAFTATTLGITKVAGIIVLTEELVRLSNPSAEALCRNDMVQGIARFIDAQFIDPAVAAVAGTNPASITNGAPTAVATTNPVADIMGLISHFATNNIPVDGVTFIMSPSNALALSFRSNLDGSPVFPGIGLNGGSYRGLQFITSNTAGTNVIAVQPQLVLYADDGGVSIDASREASLQMDSAPASPADATTVFVSLWQTNTVGLRAERFVNWLRVNPNAVKYLTAAAYPAPTGTMTEPQA
jgi:HK97 family phage major capsid protein/HK97 family phage prohead protease